MKKLMKDGHELLIKRQIKKARETKGYQVEDFSTVDEVALNLIGVTPSPPSQPPFSKPHWCYTCLQTVTSAVAGRGHGELKA
jgi:hypothetical protein